VNFYVDIAHYGVEDIIIRTLGKDKKQVRSTTVW